MINLDGLKYAVEAFGILVGLTGALKDNPDILLKDALKKTLGEETLNIALNFVNQKEDLTDYEKLQIILKAFSKFQSVAQSKKSEESKS